MPRAGASGDTLASPHPRYETMDEPEASRPPAPLPLWKKVVFGLILFSIVAVCLEVAGQVFMRVARGYSGGEFLQYEFDPYKNINLSRNWVDTRGVVQHNAQGFRRSEDVTREKPPGTFRIFLMGASTAYGLGGLFPNIQTEYAFLDNSETIDAYLEDMLQEQLGFERVEVINAGIPSVWTHHHLIYLNQTILGYDPDMILFLDGWNDHFFTDRSHDQFASYAQTEQAGAIMGPATLSSLMRMNGWWLFRKSAFAHVAIRAAQNAKTALFPGEGAPPVQVEQAVEDVQWVFERNALRMIERNALLLQHEQIPAIFFLQPILILERENLQRMPEVEQELFGFMASWRENYEEFMLRAVPIISEKIEATVTPLGGHYVDLTDIYDDAHEQVYTDYVHLTPYGNRLVAARMAREIVAVLSASHP